MSVVAPNLVLFFLMLLVLSAAIGGVLALATRSGNRGSAPGGPWAPPAPLNRAIEELDIRYARGEIERDEYLQRRADLSQPPR